MFIDKLIHVQSKLEEKPVIQFIKRDKGLAVIQSNVKFKEIKMDDHDYKLQLFYHLCLKVSYQ